MRSVDRESCRLQSFAFRGDFEIRDNTIHCIQNEDSDGLEIYDVKFRDLNGDDIMDAVISVIGRNSGSGPASRTRVVLTKLSREGDLILIE